MFSVWTCFVTRRFFHSPSLPITHTCQRPAVLGKHHWSHHSLQSKSSRNTSPKYPTRAVCFFNGILQLQNGTNVQQDTSNLPLLPYSHRSDKMGCNSDIFDWTMIAGERARNPFPTISSWWFQPIWKICSSSWIISTIFGVKPKKKSVATS